MTVKSTVSLEVGTSYLVVIIRNTNWLGETRISTYIKPE